MVGQGRFREDVYYRINLIEQRIPPVGERREDVLWLARGYLAERAEEQDGQPRQLSTGAGLAPIQRGALDAGIAISSKRTVVSVCSRWT
jgi:DNA-binding NtrC family response regulator